VRFAVGGREIEVDVVPDSGDTHTPELWPCTGEYPVYDGLLYYLMTHDRVRNEAYQAAVRSAAAGRVCLDIGTGQDLNWTRACLEAGARKVYAIEAMPESYRRARARIDKLGIGDRVHLIQGRSTDVQLPERAELCVSEIIGSIGSSEGAPEVLRDARERLLVPGAVMIPNRCATFVAAVALPEEFWSRPAFGKTAAGYLSPIFRAVGHPFDVRVMFRNFRDDGILSTTGVFEDVDFTGRVETVETRDSTLAVTRTGRMDGLILWIQLWCASSLEPIDSLKQATNWLPVFLPVFAPGTPVKEGDTVRVSCTVRTSDDRVHPDYEVDVTVDRQGVGTPERFVFASRHHGDAFRQGAFYSRLFKEVFADA
jgi:protein arginine N-methyltransferase 1